MESQDYVPRVADERLERALKRAGAVLIEGPKGCGKTETARQRAASEVKVDIDPNVAISVGIDPLLVLKGDVPRLLDEWQVQPILWDAARHEVDRRRQVGQFILTGSTAPGEAELRHSGAGRFARLKMNTMSLFESGDSSGEVSLLALAQGIPPRPTASELTIEQLAERTSRGGWPGFRDLKTVDVQANLRDYVRSVAELDIATPDNTRRDPVRVMRVLRSLSRGVGTEMSIKAIAEDSELARETVQDYVDALQRIFISEDQPAWSASLRSSAPLRKAPKRHLTDPALAIAALHKTHHDLLEDWPFFGQLFESLVVHELRGLTGEPVYHARTSKGDEVDAIVEIDGHTVLVEVKLGHHESVVNEAAASLLRFAQTVPVPVQLLVVTGGGLSYQRPDGVNVVAIGSLGP